MYVVNSLVVARVHGGQDFPMKFLIDQSRQIAYLPGSEPFVGRQGHRKQPLGCLASLASGDLVMVEVRSICCATPPFGAWMVGMSPL